jgi:acyl CoA:acetate/3-ketoacid CoA transferase beta subunit
MSERAKGLTRQQMCDRLAMEFGDGWIVNLGIGIPTLCSNFDFGDKQIIFHSENGVIGYGPLAAPMPAASMSHCGPARRSCTTPTRLR